MNLSQLYYFKKLAELQHYTKAAQELYITQPSLSGAIASLEAKLGIALFEKKGRNVCLTKYGREFYGYVCEALQTLEYGVEVAREHAGMMGGMVEIGCISTVQGHYLPKVINAFREENGKNVNFNTYQEQTNAIIEAIESEKWDVGFCSYVPNKPNLYFVPVLKQPIVAVVNNKHPLKNEKSLALSQLKGYSLISYQLDQPMGKKIESMLKSKGLTACCRYNCETEMCGNIALSEDVGIMMKVPSLRQFNDLTVIPIPEVPDDFRLVYMVFSRNAYKVHAVESFIDYVSAHWSYLPGCQKLLQSDSVE